MSTSTEKSDEARAPIAVASPGHGHLHHEATETQLRGTVKPTPVHTSRTRPCASHHTSPTSADQRHKHPIPRLMKFLGVEQDGKTRNGEANFYDALDFEEKVNRRVVTPLSATFCERHQQITLTPLHYSSDHTSFDHALQVCIPRCDKASNGKRRTVAGVDGAASTAAGIEIRHGSGTYAFVVTASLGL